MQQVKFLRKRQKFCEPRLPTYRIDNHECRQQAVLVTKEGPLLLVREVQPKQRTTRASRQNPSIRNCLAIAMG
jgi:hypothetical protein